MAADEPAGTRDEDLPAGERAHCGASLHLAQRGLVMRVLMLGTTNSPHVEDLVLGLAERGIDVVVGGDEAPNLPPRRCRIAEFASKLAPRGASRRTRSYGRVRWVRRLMREFRPDIVHAHYLVEDPFYAVLAGARPLVATAWGSDVLVATDVRKAPGSVGRPPCRPSHRRLPRAARCRRRDSARTARASDSSTGVSTSTRSPRAVPEARRRLDLPDAPDRARPARASSPSTTREIVVDAFDRLIDEFPDALLLVKYYGELPPELADLRDARRHPRRRSRPRRGAAPTTTAPRDVCVSIASSDSSPRSVWEAMACGCPCVLSDLPWVHESIEDGRDALVTPIDARSVADAIGRVLRDETLATAFAEHGRSLVERDHQRTTEIDRLVSDYVALTSA